MKNGNKRVSTVIRELERLVKLKDALAQDYDHRQKEVLRNRHSYPNPQAYLAESDRLGQLRREREEERDRLQVTVATLQNHLEVS